MAKQQSDYSRKEQNTFGTWVELGARDPKQRRFLEGSLSRRWERREPSGSDWVMELIRDPIPVLLESEGLEGITESSTVTTTILHHQRGLRKRVIVMTATVEQHSGDVSLVIDKEPPTTS